MLEKTLTLLLSFAIGLLMFLLGLGVALLICSQGCQASEVLSLKISSNVGFAPLKIQIQVHSPREGMLCINTDLHGSSCGPVHSPITTKMIEFYESDSVWASWTDGSNRAQTVPLLVEVR